MRRPTPCRTAVSGLALAAATALPAAADVTPEDVWTGLSDYLEESGYTVEATEEQTSQGLVVRGVTLSVPLATAEGSDGEVTMEIGEIRFEDLGDGSVDVVFPSSIPIVIAGEGPDVPDRMVIDTMSTALEMVVSGTPDEMVYDYTADSYVLRLSEMRIDGEAVPREDASADLTLDGLEGSMSVTETEGGGTGLVQDIRAAALSYDIAATAPEAQDADDEAGGGSFEISGRMANLVLEGDAVLPEGWDPAAFSAALGSGFDVTARMSYSDGSTQFAGEGPDGATSGQSVSDSGTLTLELGADGLSYALGASGVAYAVTVPDLPFPVTAEIDEVGVDLAMPLRESEDPQPFSLGLLLSEMAVSDTIWGLFDPDGALPRDPATLRVDLSGTVTPFVDLLDPDAVARLERTGGVPGEVNSLDIESLELDAVGARLSGEGAFTFDNSNLESFDGAPAPEGQATVTLTGAEALIDTLISMGIIGESEAMGARMMLSMFAVPGEDEDSLTSTIEIDGDGRIRANGQRIR